MLCSPEICGICSLLDGADRDHAIDCAQRCEGVLIRLVGEVDDSVGVIAARTVAHVLDVGVNRRGDGRDHVRDVLVDEAYAVAALIRNLEVREVDGVADGALFKVLGDFIDRHLRAVVLALRGGSAEVCSIRFLFY